MAHTLKTFSKQFRDSVLQLNLATPPDIVAGLSDLSGPGALSTYLDAKGKDAVVKVGTNEVAVRDAGTITQKAVAPRTAALNKNLQTPSDIVSGINDLSASQAIAAAYLDGRGKEAEIHDNAVVNPGNVMDFASVELDKLMRKNIRRNQNDPSQSDSYVYGENYTYTTILSHVGKPTVLNNYNVKNLSSVTLDSNQTPEVQMHLALQQNRYMPTEPNQFEVVVNQLSSTREPYVNMTGDFTRYQAQEYQPSQFIGGSAAQGTMSQLSANTKELLKTDTILMNIAAMELKFNYEQRIKNAIERETIGRTKLDEAATNPLTALELFSDPIHNLFERNYEITTGPGAIGKAASFAARLAGVEIPKNIIPNDKVLMPGNFGKVERKSHWSETLLDYTGGGQKHALQSNLKFNKYTPIFSQKRNAGQYIGGQNGDPLRLTTDVNGNAVISTEIMSKDFETGIHDADLSEYGKIATNFAWMGNKTKADKITDINSYERYNTLFTKGSIMGVTQEILNSLDDGSQVAKTAIDQTKRKFDDGYRIISRGSGVFGGVMTNNTDETDGSKRHTYRVPNRKKRDEMSDADLCRVWTKDRPYSKIGDAIRFKELIRKERNSVIDRNGNYNIFPSELNVNEGYGRSGNGLGDATVEAFGEKRARKYMFSLENLAWKGSSEFFNLPACEKGQNGGRIMWFPPYDINISEDTTSNWTTHSFLGRPEPIYTHNNAERSGTLSFKIVVDHPTILNTLVKYELAKMSDAQVDEILASFWSGCVEYDVFELARMWGVLSDQDISYFKNVIEDLNPSISNEKNKNRAAKSVGSSLPKEETKKVPAPTAINKSLYFENDTPYPTNHWGSDINTIAQYFASVEEATNFFTVKSYDQYFDLYKRLAKTGPTPYAQVYPNGKLDTAAAYSAYALKAKMHGTTDADLKAHYVTSADFVKYNDSIGETSGVDHFFSEEANAFRGFERQKDAIEQDLRRNEYDGFRLEIDLTSYASPINTTDYNKELAHRRFVSVVKWIVLKVLADKKPTFKADDNTVITEENIDSLFNNDTQEVVFYKNGKEKVLIRKAVYGELTDQKIKEELKAEFTDVLNIKDNQFQIPYEGKNYTCNVETADTPNNLVGNLQPKDNAVRRQADLVCSDLSIVAARARRVDVAIKAFGIETPAQPEVKRELDKGYKAAAPSVTKREIAQRLLNKLVNECDYFEYLREKSPTAYNSLKEKLKFFQPAFHAITPEGLNARLTFLQQCLRPGETISKNQGSCDAVNTSFGRPPICVLRIGDLYNTKIAISNMSINYDPLIWDLNPEGIGAQPMLATVNLGFKFIGGSGLRKYVDQLQNALSFNYYANTDMYDERTFANKDAYERNLINLEEDFFDNGTLDIEKIVDLQELQRVMPDATGDQATYIGKVAETLAPHMAGGSYYMNGVVEEISDYEQGRAYGVGDIVVHEGLMKRKVRTKEPAEIANENDPTNGKFWEKLVYGVESVVIYKGVTYTRENSDTKNPAAPVTGAITVDPKTPLVWRNNGLVNYGEEAYLKEYGKTYITLMKVDYRDTFKQLYKNYVETLGTYAGIYENTFNNEHSPLMANFMMRQSEEHIAPKTALYIHISGATAPENDPVFLSKTQDVYAAEATQRNYAYYAGLGTVSDINEQEKMKLHLYPMGDLYKITDGYKIDFPSAKVDPGAVPFYLKKEIGMFEADFKKDYINTMVSRLEQKISKDMLKFMHKNPQVFNQYVNLFNQMEKEAFRSMLKGKLDEYASSLSSIMEGYKEEVRTFNTKRAATANQLNKLSVVLNGNDGLGDKIYTEVVPNGTNVKDIEKIFGYDPYKNFPIVHYNTQNDGAVTDLKVRTYGIDKVKQIITDRQKSLAAYEQYLRLGNGQYFFKQTTNGGVFSTIADSPLLVATDVPKLVGLDTGVMPTGTTKNVETQGYIAGADGTRTNAFEPGYKMSTVFEKMSFEMFEFSNKNLSVMLNDSIADSLSSIDIVNNSDSVRKQLEDYYTGFALQPYSTDDLNTLLDQVVGDNELTAIALKTEDTLPVEIKVMIEDFNKALEFDYKFTSEFKKKHNSVDSNIKFTDVNVENVVKVNCYDEIALLGFYMGMTYENNISQKEIAELFKSALKVDVVTALPGQDKRQQKQYIEDKKAARNKVADQLAAQLYQFIQESKDQLKPLDLYNKARVAEFNANVRSILFNEKKPDTIINDEGKSAVKSLKDDNADALAEKLIREVEKTDYTLLMRQTKMVDERTKSLLKKLYQG